MDKKTPAWVSWIIRKPRLVIATVTVATLILAAGIPRLKFKTDLSDEIPDTIPEKAFFDEVGRIFPSDDVLFVALKGPKGIWDKDYINTVKAWSDAFERFNGVKGVLSLTNAGLIKGTEAGLEIENALDDYVQTPEEVESFRKRLEGQTITEALVSKDGLASAILVTVREGLDNEAVPRFSVTLKRALDEGELQKLQLLQTALREPLIQKVKVDPNVGDTPQNFDIDVRMAEGHNQQSFEAGVRRWLQQKGRIDWGLQFEPGRAIVTVVPNPNETWAKTRTKADDFVRWAPNVLALKSQPLTGPSVLEILTADDPTQKLSAAVNYQTEVKSSAEETRFLIVPLPNADVAALTEAIQTVLPDAQLVFSDRAIPFYFRSQEALKLLPQLEGAEIFVSGSRAVSSLVQGLLVRDLSLLFPVVVLVIVVVLYLSFRTLRGVVLPLINVILAVTWVLGLQGWLGVALSTATAVLPIILIAVGTAYTIHVINRSYEDLARTKDKKEALESTLTHVSVAVILAGVTTIIGFGSLAITNLSSLRDYGLLSALGIFLGLLLSLTFTPSILSLLKVPKLKTLQSHKTSVYAKVMESVGSFTTKHYKLILMTYGVLVVLAAFGATRVRFETNTLLSFRPETQIRKDTEYLNDQFTGITQLAVVVRVQDEGAILEPKVLKAMDGLQEYLKQLRIVNERVVAPGESGYDQGLPVVGGGQSITTFIKGVNKALNGDDPAFDKIPDEENPVVVKTEIYTLRPDGSLLEKDSETQEVLRILKPDEYRIDGNQLSFEGPLGDQRLYDVQTGKVIDLIPGRDYVGQLVFQYESAGKPENIEAFIDNPRRTAKINIFLKTASSTIIRGVQARAQEYITQNFPEGVKADLTGQSQLTLTVLGFLVNTQLSSLLSSLVVIFLMIALLARSVVEGVFSIVPLATAILLNFGIMGWFRIPIDISTSTIASIAIGIGIDYTLHFMERFKASMKNQSMGCALLTTMQTTGVGILFNAVAVAAGFSSLMLSQVTGNFFIGLLMALVMITSSLAAITLLPAALITFKPKFLVKRRVIEEELDDGFMLELDRCVDE